MSFFGGVKRARADDDEPEVVRGMRDMRAEVNALWLTHVVRRMQRDAGDGVKLTLPHVLARHGLSADGDWRLRDPAAAVAEAVAEDRPTLLPVHLPGHWALVVVVPAKRLLYAVDSLPMFGGALLPAITRDLAAGCGARDGRAPYATEAASVPEQGDGVSCGVFVLMYMERFVAAMREPTDGRLSSLLAGPPRANAVFADITQSRVRASRDRFANIVRDELARNKAEYKQAAATRASDDSGVIDLT